MTCCFLNNWCRALGEYFFQLKYRGKEIALCIDSELLSELAERYQLDNLIQCIEDECSLLPVRHRNPIDLADRLLGGWLRRRRAGYPPFLPVLAFLIFAAGDEATDYAEHAYWARVQRLRKEQVPNPEPLSSDKRMVEVLFRELAHWANNVRQGQLGTFDFRRLGRLRYVGLIRAQSLLSANDIRVICGAFASYDYSSAQPPSRWELLQAALSVRNELRPSLRRLFENWPGDPLSEAAVDRLEDVIEGWDGTVVSEDQLVTTRAVVLPMLLELRPTARCGLRSLLRVASGTAVPDELLLQFDERRTLLARFDAGDLSQPVEDVADERAVDACTISWTDGLRLVPQNCPSVTAVRLPGRTIRFFILQGRAWVESSMLPSHGACLIACNGQSAARVIHWLEQLGDRQPYAPLKGGPVPDGWSLLRLERRPPDSPRTDFPLPGLVASDSPAIRVQGGVRIAPSSYVPYALPQVCIGASAVELSLRITEVFDRAGHKLEGVRLHPICGSEGCYELVADEVIWDCLAGFCVEAVDAQGDVQVSKTFHVTAEAQTAECPRGRDRWGRANQPSEFCVWGLFFSGRTTCTTPGVGIGRPMPPTHAASFRDRFIRVLSTRNTMDWPTASRTARAIAEAEDREIEWSVSRSISLQFEAMRLLGYLEIEEDAAGRFGEVCRVPPCLHLLPTRAPVPGKFPLHAVLSGTYSARLRDQLLKAADKRAMATHTQHQPDGCWLVPDRTSVFCDSSEGFANLASEVGCIYVGEPFSTSIAGWLEPPTQFLDVAPWRPGPAPHAYSRLAFCPNELRLRPESEIDGNLLLYECREAYADQLWSFWLYDRAGNRHCMCPRQLGRWIVFLTRSTPPRGIPTSATGELYLPIELRPPQLVERAICACSGLTPALVTFPDRMPQLSQLGYPESPRNPSEWFRASSQIYSGHWLRYERVRHSPLVSTLGGEGFFGCLGLRLAQVPIILSQDLRIEYG